VKFSHDVKHNGVYYPAGTEVPIETKKSEGVKAPAPLVSGKVDEVKEDVVITDDKPRKYSEEDLDLPYMKLKAMAKKEGFKVDNTLKAYELKNMLRSL
jgi:hypothetical protein